MAFRTTKSARTEVICYADGKPVYADLERAGWDLELRYIKEERLAARGQGYVYFIQAVHGGPVKIGYSTFPRQRIEALQTSTPYALRICKLIKGALTEEREMHERFAEQRLTGEWFDPSPEMSQLADVRIDMGTPIVKERCYTKAKQTDAMREAKLEREYATTLYKQRVYGRKRKRRP